MSHSLISVIVPCYNQAGTVLETLQSITAQTHPDWECIIVNDGSTDDSQAIIEGYIGQDARFRLVSIKNSGVSTARNTGVSYAKGDYIFPLDGDNYMHADCLKKLVAVFEERPGTRLVYSEAVLFGEETGLWRLPPFDYKTMLKYNMVDNSSLFLRSDFNRVGGYRTNMVYGLEDWDFFISLLHGATHDQVVKVPEPLYYYRVVNTGRRLTVAASSRQEDMKDTMVYNNFFIYKEFFPDIFNRIHEYQFQTTMLNKKPVKFLVNTLMRISALKNKFSGTKK